MSRTTPAGENVSLRGAGADKNEGEWWRGCSTSANSTSASWPKSNWPKSKLAEVEFGRSRTHGVCSFSSVSAFSHFLLFILYFVFFFSSSVSSVSSSSSEPFLKRHVAHARCRRVLVVFAIGFWFTCVRHGPVARSVLLPIFSLRFQVMSQPRRSAHLAARFQSARSSPPSQPSQPMAIDLMDTEPLSDGLSDNLSSPRICPLPLPASSVTATSLLLVLSLVASCKVAPFPSTCSVSPIWCICLLNLWSAPLQLSVSFLNGLLHFQHLCCGRHVEAPAASGFPLLSLASSFSLPCCRQRIHYECLARSVHACVDHCPFCTQDLVPVLSDPLLAASFEHLDIPSISTRPLQFFTEFFSLCVPDDMPHPPPILPLCCAHSCGLLISNDRRMEEVSHSPFSPRLFF